MVIRFPIISNIWEYLNSTYVVQIFVVYVLYLQLSLLFSAVDQILSDPGDLKTVATILWSLCNCILFNICLNLHLLVKTALPSIKKALLYFYEWIIHRKQLPCFIRYVRNCADYCIWCDRKSDDHWTVRHRLSCSRMWLWHKEALIALQLQLKKLIPL